MLSLEQQALFERALADARATKPCRSDSESILCEAIEELDARQRPALCWRQSRDKPMAAMYQQLQQVQRSVHIFEKALHTLHSRHIIEEWGASARATRPERAGMIAQEVFDSFDTTYCGTLTNDAAARACDALHQALGVTFQGSFPPAPDAEGGYNYHTWLQAMLPVCSLPAGAKQELEKVNTGCRCNCGAWMKKQATATLYGSTPGIRCDFSGEAVTSDAVWHCPNGKAPSHPFGFDIGIENTDKFRRTQRLTRLYKRMGARLSNSECGEGERSDLAARREAVARQLLSWAEVGFRMMAEDTARLASAGEEASAELKANMAVAREIVATEDWNARLEKGTEEAKALVQALRSSLEGLGHEKMHFRDEADKAVQLAALDAQFDGAAKHDAFNKVMAEVKKCADFCKELDGLQALDLNDDEVRPFVDALAQRMLEVLLQGMPPINVQGVRTSVDWTDAGMKFTWEIMGPAMGGGMGHPILKLDHTIRMDARDMAQQRLQHDFVEQFHEVRERITSLKDCATDADLSACIEKVECNGSEGICVVCQEDFCAGECATRLRACGHVFHEDCINGWLLGCKNECPVCKASLQPEPADPKASASAAAAAAAEATSARRFEIGSVVRVQGLVNAQQHNGEHGVVEQWIESRGRYAVRLATGQRAGKVLHVRGENLQEILRDWNLQEEDEEEGLQQELTAEDTSNAEDDSFDSEDEDEELAMAIRMSLQDGSVSVGQLSQRQEEQQQFTADLDGAMDLDSTEEEAEERDVAGHNEMIEREMALRRQRRH